MKEPLVNDTVRGLAWLIEQLDALEAAIDESSARRLFTAAVFGEQELRQYIASQPRAYARRAVVRRERYELLVLTWLPGQGSVAHDHSGSLCGLKVIQGTLVEQLFQSGPDGQVRTTTTNRLKSGEISVDPGVIVHSLSNPPDSGETLVTVHLYSPPLPEVRRYAVAEEEPARVIAIIGGGFTGTMTAANLLRMSRQASRPLKIVMIDSQPAVGEGVAYRTNDCRHLLNVTAGKMSAWPDRPDDFLNFAQALDAAVKPGDFLPRKLFGQYVRQTFLDAARSANDSVAVELIRDQADSLVKNRQGRGWTVKTAGGKTISANATVIALGHRPPAEEFIRRWRGPRPRFVANPWASLVLSQIGPDESVLILGNGLTAVDAILTLDQPDRTAPLNIVSRHGYFPQPHGDPACPPQDLSRLVTRWLAPSTSARVRRLFRDLRREIQSAAKNSIDWRQVIDGLRPHIAKIWARLEETERAIFFRHVRPLWEVHRHRMAPSIAARIGELRQNGLIHLTAGALVSAEADENGIDVVLTCRGKAETRRIRVSWVVNCTGPGVHHRRSTHPLLRPLIDSGVLCGDPLGLGLRTDAEGRAIGAAGEIHADLLVAGTLRKATLWESTAVPELRQQAAITAEIAWREVQPVPA